MDLYWLWVNDDEVRKNSINKECISAELHEKWFKSKLQDNNMNALSKFLYRVFNQIKVINSN